ncbi:hypothetical protein RM553_13880 [Zunongwangia sp. F363]|uniref:1,4-alpha-glucan branching enzyme n=1 Tax=Autumnicola tepida TaxID=3075595 RepID=A0ABU3CC49_9FLAO|nr:hypothetical protein [Zunongwangia sp. F363]MDT0643923.1 hypothetical protein [Zunongwangia sp. F363]
MATQDSKTTTDHETIKKWVEERDGQPALVKGTTDSGKGGGLLRINFPGYAEENLENIEWDKFFTIFDENNLQFLYQEKLKDGNESRFFKFIGKD